MGETRITDRPEASSFVRFRPGGERRFLLTVDTEEEFDWNQPLRRSGHSLDTIPRLRKFQQFCERHGVVPVYLIDYPIANSALVADILRGPIAEGKAEVGVQLHPWVSPPHDEEVNQYNSFAGNLPPALELAKLKNLRNTIERNFGAQPLIYRAGRYGVGPNTARFLGEVGIAIDTSVRSRFDYSAGGGPNFRDLPLRPWWIGKAGGLMELPLTTVFQGVLRRWGSSIYPRLWRTPRMRGLLARMGLLDRIPLTPEGVGIEEALRGIDIAVAEDIPVLVFSFHSPSLSPGFTPYVREVDDLDDFYEWWRQAFARLAEHGVRPTTVKDIMESVALA
ncbi:MAG: polysaccharide deacetylase family protein [Novosphingobium sp.]